MKKLSLPLFLSIVCLIVQAQDLPIDSISKKVTYQEVVKVDGASKNELYARAREWFAKTFKSADDVLQMEDMANGKLIGKGCNYQSKVFYTVSVSVKDGRYRYEITDFYTRIPASQYSRGFDLTIEADLNSKYSKNKKGEYRLGTINHITHTKYAGENIVYSLKKAMLSPPVGHKSKDDF